MALRPSTIRFAPDAHDLIHEAAHELGISFAQFVREAALMRAAVTMREGEVKRLASEVARLSAGDREVG